MERGSSPYRQRPVVHFEEVEHLERENARLRSFIGALVFVALVLGGVAAWWFSVLWKAAKG
jgi:hypothetical protein